MGGTGASPACAASLGGRAPGLGLCSRLPWSLQAARGSGPSAASRSSCSKPLRLS